MEQSKIIDTTDTYHHSTVTEITRQTEVLKPLYTAMVVRLLIDLTIIYSTLIWTLPVTLLLYVH